MVPSHQHRVAINPARNLLSIAVVTATAAAVVVVAANHLSRRPRSPRRRRSLSESRLRYKYFWGFSPSFIDLIWTGDLYLNQGWKHCLYPRIEQIQICQLLSISYVFLYFEKQNFPPNKKKKGTSQILHFFSCGNLIETIQNMLCSYHGCSSVLYITTSRVRPYI